MYIGSAILYYIWQTFSNILPLMNPLKSFLGLKEPLLKPIYLVPMRIMSLRVTVRNKKAPLQIAKKIINITPLDSAKWCRPWNYAGTFKWEVNQPQLTELLATCG